LDNPKADDAREVVRLKVFAGLPQAHPFPYILPPGEPVI
jgi:hypothetical protein